jgi:hypothetical protein
MEKNRSFEKRWQEEWKGEGWKKIKKESTSQCGGTYLQSQILRRQT